MNQVTTAILALGVLVSIPLALEARDTRRKLRICEQEQARRVAVNKREAEVKDPLQEVALTMAAALDEYAAQRHENRHDERRRRCLDILTTGGIYLAAIVAAFAICFSHIDSSEQIAKLGEQIGAMKRQVSIMESQARIMENDQRPWIKLEVAISGPLQFIPLALQLHEERHLATMPLHITLSNVGKSPAFNIQVGIWGYLIYPGHNDPNRNQTLSCEGIRTQPLDNPARGAVLFPGDSVPWDRAGGMFTSVVGFTPDEIRKVPADANGQRNLDVWIFGCADYILSDTKTHHQTGFMYRLAQITPREGMQPLLLFGVVSGVNIAADQLILVPSPSASGQTD